MSIAKVLNPKYGHTISWLILLILSTSAPVNYESPIKILTVFYIIICIIFFYVGTLLPKKPQFKNHDKNIKKATLHIITIASILYSVIILYEAYQKGIVNVISSGNMADLRAEHWEDYITGNRNFMTYIKALTLPFALIGSLLIIKKSTFKIGLLSLTSVIVTSFLIGGRSLVVFTIAMIAISWLILKPKNRKKINFPIKIAIITITLFSLYVFFIWWPSARNQDLFAHYDYYLYINTSAHISEAGELLAKYLGKEAVYSYIFSMTYFTSPPYILDIYINHSDIKNWETFGGYHFPFITNLINTVKDKNQELMSFVEIRGELGSVTNSWGLNSNIWATGIRDYIVDFGLILTPFIVFLFGFISKYIYKLAFEKSNFLYVILCANITLLWLFFPYMSLLVVHPLRNMIFALFGLLIIETILQKKGI